MTHRKFLIRCWPILMVGLLIGAVPAKAGTATVGANKRPPNIIVIFMDDMGYGDVDAYGGIDYHTPNIDRLAKQGMRFTNFYAAQSICTMSLAGLLTGAYPNRLGLHMVVFPTSNKGLSSKDETVTGSLNENLLLLYQSNLGIEIKRRTQ